MSDFGDIKLVNKKLQMLMLATSETRHELINLLAFQKLRNKENDIVGYFSDIALLSRTGEVIIIMEDENGGKWRRPLDEFEILGLYNEDEDEDEEW